MIASLHNGVTALKSLTQGLQTLGNNIANVNSLGYKASRVNYSDNFYLHIQDAESNADGAPRNQLQQFGTGVHVGSVTTNFNQGTIDVTGLDLDLAIEGGALPNAGGFFEVTDPATGELFYTRAGSFETNIAGVVVTRDRFRYQLQGQQPQGQDDGAPPQHGPLLLAAKEGEALLARRVEEDGKVNLLVNKDGQDTLRPAGQVRLVNFSAPQYLRRVGNGYFSNGLAGQNIAGKLDNSLPTIGSNGKIRQYALELSNVDLTNEFASMITHQRSFQAGSRVVTTSDMILSEAVNLKR
jgi:flagellar hook protein FlgE